MENLTLLEDLNFAEFRALVEKNKYLQNRIKEMEYNRIEFCVGNLRVRDFKSVEEYLAQVTDICNLFSDDLVGCAYENDWLLEDADGNYEEILVDTKTMTAYKLVAME